MERIKKELELLKEKGQFRTVPDIKGKADKIINVGGNIYLNFASNDYLGISTKDFLREEFLKNNTELLSSASARLLTGSCESYNSLEKTSADIFNKENSLIFNTGYQANLGVISALINKGDIVFSDKLNHASIIDGMKLSNGDFVRYRHLDYDNLENLLEKKREDYKRALIVTESVFSMDGDIADIERLIKIKNKYNCMLMVDEAHAFCAMGKTLGGITQGGGIDIITATFGKAVGSFGAFCASDNDVISYLINKARSFIFSTSIPPLNISWSNWLLTEKRKYLLSQKAKLKKVTKEVHSLLDEYGIKTPSSSHIIPIITGDNETTIKVSEELKAKGFYIPAIRPPTVPEGSSRLRISLTADSCKEDFIKILEIVSPYIKQK